ncbi:MAG: tetratricopeptide repeat protein [Bryobacterales bacterium]|nr:tetratricopeptide repeat protein [Bryobacterales bacterium]
MQRSLILLLFIGCAAAQHTDHSPATGKPLSLIPGLGTWKHRINTRNPEAQKFFDQGLILLYSFNRPEAIRSFRRAAELDPDAPMVWWGVSLAAGPYINMDGDPTYDIKESCAALAKGLALKADPRELAWLEAAQARCPGYANPERYIEASKALADKFPDDLDAQVLFAESIMIPSRWKWYSADGKPADRMPEAERTLESVLRRDPAHPGANHYYIHVVESSPTPERAIASAQRLMGIVPAAGHIVHMPGHIWLVLGDFNMTVSVNERAADLDRKYFAATSVENPYYMYYLHNLHFILYARDMQGRVADARKAERTILDTVAPISKSMPEMAGVFAATVTFSRLRTARWDEVLAAGKPGDGGIGDAVALYARTVALAMKGRAAEARGERDEFEKVKARVDRTGQWGVNRMGDVIDLASTVLGARTAASPAAAVPFWRQAVTLQDRLSYDEPPAWYYPVRESLGSALLISGDAVQAELVFRDALRRSPHNGRVLFGLLESLKAQKKTDAVESVQREFDAAWKGADLKLRLEEL